MRDESNITEELPQKASRYQFDASGGTSNLIQRFEFDATGGKDSMESIVGPRFKVSPISL